MTASNHDLEDVYASAGQTFTGLKRLAGHRRDAPDAFEIENAKAFARMLHIDDEERYAHWSAFLDGAPITTDFETRRGRLDLMLFAALGYRSRPIDEVGDVLRRYREHPILSSELRQLLEALRDRSRNESQPIDRTGIIQVQSHPGPESCDVWVVRAAIAGYGLISKGLLRESREGLAWAEGHRTDVFFVTLNKSDEDYSPTTRYQDYPISPTLFHWESQSRTAVASPTGQRYINHVALGSKVVLCVRENKQDSRGCSRIPTSASGQRDSSGTSRRSRSKSCGKLERPMPTEMYQSAKVAAGLSFLPGEIQVPETIGEFVEGDRGDAEAGFGAVEVGMTASTRSSASPGRSSIRSRTSRTILGSVSSASSRSSDPWTWITRFSAQRRLAEPIVTST